MNYQDLNESQKAHLMDITIKFLMSTVDGYCANEADANKQEYATRLLLHLKPLVDQIIDTKETNGLSAAQRIEELEKEVERLKTIEQAYEAYKSAH
ncbi:hypothetical protein [Bacillus nitroreducens]